MEFVPEEDGIRVNHGSLADRTSSPTLARCTKVPADSRRRGLYHPCEPLEFAAFIWLPKRNAVGTLRWEGPRDMLTVGPGSAKLIHYATFPSDDRLDFYGQRRQGAR
jgi:hypothetical protein